MHNAFKVTSFVYTDKVYTSGDYKVTKKWSPANDWIHQKQWLLFPLLAFIIPLLVRFVPEVLMGQFVTGFDTMAYFVPNTIVWLRTGVEPVYFLSVAPLLYLLLMGITSTGASIVIALKILSPILLGLLGIAIYSYARRVMFWSPGKSLVVALLGALYFVALRISWDMFRSEIATILLFFALILLAKNKMSLRNGFLLSLSMFLIVLAHQLVSVIMFVVVIATLASMYFKKNNLELRKVLICAIPAAATFLSIIFIDYFIFSLPVIGITITNAGGLTSIAPSSYINAIVDTIGFFVFCFLPLLPLIALGAKDFKGNIQLKAWMVWTIIPVVLAIIIPSAFLGGVFPYRWIMLLTYPFAFLAVDGLSRIQLKWVKIAVGLLVALLVCGLSVGFLVQQNNNAFEYFGTYPSYVPKSMLQNTVPASDTQDTANVLVWARTNIPANGRLLVHEAFYGWGALYFDSSQLIHYGFLKPEQIAKTQMTENPSNPLYLIWWVNGTGWYGQQTVPATFQPLYMSGNMAIYNYTSS